jgi:preprotein translocase subunit SecA
VLVGTASVQESEELSLALNAAGIPHRVLNARQNAQEADIISEAGRPGTVTVATNMAGRGTDIVLGGHDDVKENRATLNASVLTAGGLHVLATQRHESRRVDDQLRGRAGRQGDPGSSQFYLSLDDELLRIFGSTRLERLFKFAGITTEALSNNTLDKAVRQAQEKLEGRNFESRKNLAKYDTVLASQRQIVYAHRRQILNGGVRISDCLPFVEQAARVLAERYAPLDDFQENWDLKALKDALLQEFGVNVPLLRWVNVEALDSDVIHEKIVEEALTAFEEARADNPDFTEADRRTLLAIVDELWRGHLTHLSEMRESIHFRGYASQDPVTAYKREAFNAFTSLWNTLELRIAQALVNPPVPAVPAVIEVGVPDAPEATNAPASGSALYTRVSRNEMCPCGSGLRYKHCHGKIA